MRLGSRPLLAVLVLLLAAAAGCADVEGPDAEELFPQAGDDPGSQAPDASIEAAGQNASVHFVDVGQGDGIVVHLPDHTAVYDTGRWYGDSRIAVREHLEAEGADPDALVLSHPDADHAGGCTAVLEAFDVEAIYHPGIDKDTQTWAECKQAMRAEEARLLTAGDLAVGQALGWSEHATVRLLHADAETGDPNAASLALEVTYGGTEIVLAGDMTCEVEEAILERGLVDGVDLVQVAHHGSSTSTCEPWLEATQPEVGVVSLGADNDYGHPHAEVLDRLARHGIDVYRTDTHGSIEVRTNGTGWDVATTTGEPSSDPSGTGVEANGTAREFPVSIGRIHADAEGDDHENLDDEWIEVVNEGNATVDVGGWSLSDEAGHTYEFPANVTIGPDAGVQLHTGSGEDTDGHLYWGREQAVWNNAGDRATLRDAAGDLVDEKGY